MYEKVANQLYVFEQVAYFDTENSELPKNEQKFLSNPPHVLCYLFLLSISFILMFY